MLDKKDASGCLLPDEERTTKIGFLLRKYSLDELPQIINILKGEMSWIGPRPLLAEYGEIIGDKLIKRHRVKPGITGWAQINGRNEIEWAKKMELDNYYADYISAGLDLKIIRLSILYLIHKKNGDIPMSKLKKEDLDNIKV